MNRPPVHRANDLETLADPVSGDEAASEMDAEVLDAVDAAEEREAVVAAGHHGLRLDKWLVEIAPEFSRSHLQTLIELGQVRCEGRALTVASRKVLAGQRLQVRLTPTAQSLAFRPEAMALDIVFEDDDILVVNKPAGLVVHPAAGHWSGTLLNGLLAHHAGARMLPRAGIVHRLDKDTSGLMVVARTLPAQTALVRDIAARSVRREYFALVHGQPRWDALTIEAPIGRDPVSRVRMAVVAQGKPARTDVRVVTRSAQGSVGRHGGCSVVHCRLHTGRTHQIRVHLSHHGHPLLADAIYGGAEAAGLRRQALHAARLGLTHPTSGEALSFEAPLPADLRQACAQLRISSADVALGFGYNEAQFVGWTP